MTESDMTSSKLVFIDIDGTLADENILCRSRQKRRVRGPKPTVTSSSSAPVVPCRKSNATFWVLDSTAWCPWRARRQTSVTSCCSSTSYRPKPLMRRWRISPSIISKATNGRVRTACTFPKVIAAIWSPRARRGIVVSLRGSGICWTRSRFRPAPRWDIRFM